MKMACEGRGATRVPMLLLAVLSSLLAAAESSIALLPKHYEYSEKFSCVKKLDVFLDRGALLSYSTDFLGSWPGNTNFDCRTTVYSKTANTGIIAVIQALRFRKVSETCKDYVRFDEDTTDRCGEIAFGLKRSKSGKLPPSPEFISAYSGLFARHLKLYSEGVNIDARKRFVSPGSWVATSYSFNTDLHVHSQPALEFEEDLQFVMTYTGFQDCEDTKFAGEMFNCGYGVCILNVFVNDGVVNCPFGDCRDEGGCDNAIRTSPIMAGTEVNATEAPVAKSTAGHTIQGQGVGAANVIGHYASGVPVAYAWRQSPSAIAGSAIGDIDQELKKHNDILGRISSLIERGVESLEGGKAGEGGKEEKKGEGGQGVKGGDGGQGVKGRVGGPKA